MITKISIGGVGGGINAFEGWTESDDLINWTRIEKVNIRANHAGILKLN